MSHTTRQFRTSPRDAGSDTESYHRDPKIEADHGESKDKHGGRTEQANKIGRSGIDLRSKQARGSRAALPSGQTLSVLLLDTKADNVNHYIVLSILAVLKSSIRVAHVELANYATAVRRAQSMRFDMLLAVDGEAINIDILARLKTLVGTTVLWAWEDPYERARTVALAQLFNLIFTNDSGSVDAYPAPVFHLPLAGTQSIPVRRDDADYDYDLSFVGSAWPNRVVFLRRLLRTLPKLRTRIVLAYNSFLPRTYLDLPESSYVGTLSHHDFLHTANRSRICLSLDRDFSGDGLRTRARTPGPRIFEIALAGGYQIVDGTTNEVESFFDCSQEIATYRQFGECLDKIETALADPALRINRAVAAQARAAREHGYANRVDVILDHVESLSRRPERAACNPQKPKRTRILFVTHNTIAAGNFGGVEVYQETLANELRAEFEIYYYRPGQPAIQAGRRVFVLTDSRHNIVASYSTPDFDIVNALTQPEAEAHFAHILTEQSIDLVHFQHLINHCASLPIIARMLGVPSVASLHDYWLICTRFALIDHRGVYCRIADRPKATCDVCLQSADDIAPGAQDYRRRFLSAMLAGLDRLIGGSDASVSIFRRIYPDLPSAAFTVIGVPIPHAVPAAARPASHEVRGHDPRLRVVFLGNFSTLKGAQTFLDAARLLRDDDIMLTICGRIDSPYDKMLEHANLANVTVEGEFHPGELDLSRFEVSLHLSVWPETYCITLSEAWKAGLIPIVTTCGALEERVTDQKDGYHIPIDGAGELVALLRRLADNPQEVEERRAAITSQLFLSPSQHCLALRGVYSDLLNTYKLPHRPVPPKLDTGNPTNFALLGQRLTPPYWTRPNDVQLPSPPDAQGPLLSPLRRHLPAIASALQGGRISTISPLRWHIDSIGSVNDPYRRDVAQSNPAVCATTLPRLPVQLFGWLRPSTSVPSNLMLAVRSAAHDLILRPAYLHDRADLQNGEAGGENGIGFATDPFPPEMLEHGVYGVEFFWLLDDVLKIVPIAALSVTRERISFITAPAQMVIRVPLPGAAWRALVPLPTEVVVGVVDDLEILPTAPGDLMAASILFVTGWAFVSSAPGRIAHAALQFSGAVTFHVALTQIDRADVVDTLNRGAIAAPGYAGAVSLGFLPHGTYVLELIKYLPEGLAKRPLGELCIDVHGHARVKRYKEASEVEDQHPQSVSRRASAKILA